MPLKKPIYLLENTSTKFIPKVSSARAAKLIFRRWSEQYNRVPDAVVVEGPMAGGHLGFKKKMDLFQKSYCHQLLKKQ